MAMETVERGIENHRAPEQRRDFLLTRFHAPVPQLEGPAKLCRPILVEIDQQVELALELELFVDVEVGMDSKVTAGFRFVEPAADEMRVGDQAGDAGHLFEESEKRLPV